VEDVKDDVEEVDKYVELLLRRGGESDETVRTRIFCD